MFSLVTEEMSGNEEHRTLELQRKHLCNFKKNFNKNTNSMVI